MEDIGLQVEAGNRGPFLISWKTHLQHVQTSERISFKWSVMKPSPFYWDQFLKTVDFEVFSSRNQEKSGFEKRLWDRFLPSPCLLPFLLSQFWFHCLVTFSSMFSHHPPSLSRPHAKTPTSGISEFSRTADRTRTKDAKVDALHCHNSTFSVHSWTKHAMRADPERIDPGTCFSKQEVFQFFTDKKPKINGFEKICYCY